MSLTLGVTGNRNFITKSQATTLRAVMRGFDLLAHGDCVGADEAANRIAVSLKKAVDVYPPTDPKLRSFCDGPLHFIHEEAPYLERNAAIVEAADFMVGLPDTFYPKPDGGTWWTIKHTVVTRGWPLTVIWPDGSTTDGDQLDLGR